MARCGCSGTCGCKLVEGTRVSISGTGTPDDPYIIGVDAEGDTVTTTELDDRLAMYVHTPALTDTDGAVPVKQSDGSYAWVALDTGAALQEAIYDTTATAGQTKTMPNPVSSGSHETFWRILAQGNFTIGTLPVITTPGAIAVTLKIKQDATGGRTVTFPTIDWVGGAQPTVATAPNAVTYITLWTEGSSDPWHGIGNTSGYTVRVVTHASTGAALTVKGGEVVLADTSGGTIALVQEASSLNSRDSVVKWVAGTTVPTLTLAAGDHINTSAGGTSVTFYELTEAYRMTPDGGTIWAITGMDISVARLVRIPSTGVTSGYVPVANGSGGYAWAAQTGGSAYDQRWEPADNSLKAANMDPGVAAGLGNTNLSASTTYVCRLKVKAGVVITGVALQLLVAGVGALGGGYQVVLASNDATGTVVAQSADVQTSFSTAGALLLPFASTYTPSADGYMFVALRTGTAATTMPKLSGGNSTGNNINVGLTTGTPVAPNATGAPRFATSAAAWTVPTAPSALGNITSTSSLGMFVGLY